MTDPEVAARRVLRWDAGYCGLTGALVVAFAAPLGAHLGVPAWLAVLAGFAVLAWAGIVWSLARGDEWWGPTAMVAGAKAVAAVLLTVWAAGTGGPGGAVLGLVAAQVWTFAGLQALALVRGWAGRSV